MGSLSASSGLEWASDRVKPEGKVSWWVRNMHALDIDGTGAYAEMERNIVHPNSAFMASWTVAMLVSIMAYDSVHTTKDRIILALCLVTTGFIVLGNVRGAIASRPDTCARGADGK